MESKTWTVLAVVLLAVIPQHKIGAACSFPSSLRGLWISTYNGAMMFEVSAIHGYRTSIPSGERLSFLCSSSNGTLYTLKSSGTVPVFGNPVYLFLCLEIIQLTKDIFRYKIRSDYENLLKEFVAGHNDPDFTYSCANGTDKELTLVRNVSKTSNVIGEDCPSIINGIYGNNTSDGSNSNICYSGFINSSHTSPQLSIYVDSSCMNDFGVSTFTCLHYSHQFGNYLYTWTNNTALLKKSPYGYFCLNITTFEDKYRISIMSEVCSESNEVILILELLKQKEKNDWNMSQTDGKKTINGSLLVILVCAVLFSLACTVIFLLHCNRKKLSCFRKEAPVYRFDDVATRT